MGLWKAVREGVTAPCQRFRRYEATIYAVRIGMDYDIRRGAGPRIKKETMKMRSSVVAQ
jgi:hypothetical protein